MNVKDRLYRLSIPEPNTGCWLWLGTLNGKEGYGMFNKSGTNLLAHRVSYEEFVGAIPSGLVIDHKCRQRSCINPQHLRAVTTRQNNIYSGECRIKTGICKRGHYKQGRKDCPTCNLEGVRRRRARLREARNNEPS